MRHRLLAPARVPALIVLLGLVAVAQPTNSAGWHTIFDGQSLAGWTAVENPDSFRLEDGALLISGPRAHLFYTGELEGASFENFLFEAEVKTEKGANSGIFFHTALQDRGWPSKGYESQINATHGDSIKSGSLYGVVKVDAPGHEDGKWYRHEIAVKRDHVEVRINGRSVVSWHEPANRKGKQRLSRGTFAIQAHDPQSVVRIRKIRVKPLPTDNGALSRAERRLLRPGYGWWNAMDFGPFVSSTVEIDAQDTRVLKGLTVDLTPDQRMQATFDTDLLRWGAAFRGPLELFGVTFNGGHGGNPKVRGERLFTTGNGPGWSLDGNFEDPREIPHGPLPTSIGRYTGLYRHGDRVLFDYEVGGRRVSESPLGAERLSTEEPEEEVKWDFTHQPFFIRQLKVGAGDRPLFARLADVPEHATIELSDDETTGMTVTVSGAKRLDLKVSEKARVGYDRSLSRDQRTALGAPSKKDAADHSRGAEVVFSAVPGHGNPHPLAGAEGLTLPRVNDGEYGQNDDDTSRAAWFDAGRFRLLADLGRMRRIERVDTWTWHRTNRGPQRYVLYGHRSRDGDATAKRLDKAGWVKVAEVDSRFLGEGGRHVTAVLSDAGSIGRFSKLLWDWRATSNNEGQFVMEIDVWTDEVPAPPLEDAAQSAGESYRLLVGTHAPGRLVSRKLADGSRVLALEVPASDADLDLRAMLIRQPLRTEGEPHFSVSPEAAVHDFDHFETGGPAQYVETIELESKPTKARGAWAVDDIPVPFENPWGSYMRIGGFDFFADGKSAAVCTWNGDVWIVDGLGEEAIGKVTWKRFATGLFETLGLRIVDEKIYVNGKDQLTRLHDLNGDGEADFYENFCNLALTTENFHEFTFDLQTDDAGYFYVSKAAPVRPGGRGFDKIVPHHGAILRIAPDGRAIEVFATGLRAPNGIAVGPDGQVTAGDNEGTWVPHCKLHWFYPGSFQGVMDTAHWADRPKDYNPPLCWFPMEVDNSGGGQAWVTSDRWAPMKGELLHFSYGQSSIYRVLRDPTADPVQGAVVKLPVRLGSSAMRGRFSPRDGQLYVAGLKGWQTNAARAGAIQRIRYTGKPMRMPVGLDVKEQGIELTFSEPLDAELATDPKSYALEWWNYVWGPMYGSPEISANQPDKEVVAAAQEREMQRHKKHDRVVIKRASLSDDGLKVFLQIEGMKPVMQFQLGLDLETKTGEELVTKIWGTINDPKDPR